MKSEERERGDYRHYVDVPWEQRKSSGGRNLAIGAIILLIALLALGEALHLAGTKAVLSMISALVAFAVVFVLARLRMFKQRNGGFLAFALICLFAALIPLIDYGIDRERPQNGKQQAPSDVAKRTDAEIPLLSQNFKIPSLSENTPRFKVLQDLQVKMATGKTYLIKQGEVFPVEDRDDKEVRFLADDQKIGLPVEMVEPIGNPTVASAAGTPSGATPRPETAPPAAPNAGSVPPADRPETPAQITERAQKEAIRRYPALGQKDSPENHLFVETFQELKHSGADDFFADPEWPIQLAELLAKREKWERQPSKSEPPADPAN